jgi:hypothetical protein
MQPKIGKLNTCEELVQHQGLSRASHEAPSFPHNYKKFHTIRWSLKYWVFRGTNLFA